MMFLQVIAMLVTLFGGGYMFLRRYATHAVHDHDNGSKYCPCERCFYRWLDEIGP